MKGLENRCALVRKLKYGYSSALTEPTRSVSIVACEWGIPGSARRPKMCKERRSTEPGSQKSGEDVAVQTKDSLGLGSRIR